MRAHMCIELSPVSHAIKRLQMDLILLLDFLTMWYIAKNAVIGGSSAVILVRNFAISPANLAAPAKTKYEPPITQVCLTNLPKRRECFVTLLNVPARHSAMFLKTHNCTAILLQAATSNPTRTLLRWWNKRLPRRGANSWTRRTLPHSSVIKKMTLWPKRLRR